MTSRNFHIHEWHNRQTILKALNITFDPNRKFFTQHNEFKDENLILFNKHPLIFKRNQNHHTWKLFSTERTKSLVTLKHTYLSSLPKFSHSTNFCLKFTFGIEFFNIRDDLGLMVFPVPFQRRHQIHEYILHAQRTRVRIENIKELWII